MHASRRLLIYSHDSFGLGHLRRCRAIAHDLVDRYGFGDNPIHLLGVDALDKGTFETVLGAVSFNRKGDMSLPGFVIYTWRDGRLAAPDTVLGAR